MLWDEIFKMTDFREKIYGSEPELHKCQILNLKKNMKYVTGADLHPVAQIIK